jgi:PAT family beta-lactamase induction signal transducer AmpG
MGVLFALLALGTLWLPPRVAPDAALRTPVRVELLGFAAMVAAGGTAWWLSRRLSWLAVAGEATDGRFGTLAFDTLSMIVAFVAAIAAARRVGFPSFVEPWDAFFARPRALALLLLIVAYKLGDAFAGSLSTAFLIRGAGFSVAEVGTVNKVLGLVATVVGTLAGGAWLARRSLFGALMGFGLLQAVSNLGYWLLAVLPKSYLLMAAAIGVENLCGGLGTAAFVALLMALTDRRFSAAQYALLSALSAVGRVYVGPAAGVMVQAWGWSGFFLFTVAVALPGLLLLGGLRSTIDRLDQPEHKESS